VQLLSQQYPSMHLPLAQIVSVKQGVPLGALQPPEPSHFPAPSHGVLGGSKGNEGLPALQIFFVQGLLSSGKSVFAGCVCAFPFPSHDTSKQSPSICVVKSVPAAANVCPHA
jgi:hypothetical protein